MEREKEELRAFKIRRGGFTLVEILVALSVIVALGAITFVAVKDYIMAGRRASTHASIVVISTAVNRYRYLHEKMPTNFYDMVAERSGEKGPLLSEEDIFDHWNNKFNYHAFKSGITVTGYSLWSNGPDGKNDSGSSPTSFVGDDIGIYLKI